MKDISSIILITFAILSLGIRLFKKTNTQRETQPKTPAQENKKQIATNREEKPDLPMSRPYDAPSKTEEPIAKQPTKTQENPENPSISDDFDLAKAIIYSEILNTKTFDE